MSHSRVNHPYAQPAAGGLVRTSQSSAFPQSGDNRLQRRNHGEVGSYDTATVNNEGTLLHEQKLKEVKKDLKKVLGQASQNLRESELTQHAWAVRNELVKDLNAFYCLLEKLSSSQKKAAHAIRLILQLGLHTKSLDTKSAGEQIDKASESLTEARTELQNVEKRLVVRADNLKDTANLEPTLIQKAGNYVANKKLYTVSSVASASSGLVGAALKFATTMDHGTVITASLALFTAFLTCANLCKEGCPDAAAYAKLPETRKHILTVADSITELLNVLEDIKQTWRHVDRARLKNDGTKRHTSELTPAVLVSVVNALNAHSEGVDQLLDIMQTGMPVAQRVADNNATLSIEPPQPPPKAANGALGFLRGSDRRDRNLGAYDMA